MVFLGKAACGAASEDKLQKRDGSTVAVPIEHVMAPSLFRATCCCCCCCVLNLDGGGEGRSHNEQLATNSKRFVSRTPRTNGTSTTTVHASSELSKIPQPAMIMDKTLLVRTRRKT